ncbi:hypothetical protein V1527DRAFT_474577 [Lipomyces starkeyi]
MRSRLRPVTIFFAFVPAFAILSLLLWYLHTPSKIFYDNFYRIDLAAVEPVSTTSFSLPTASRSAWNSYGRNTIVGPRPPSECIDPFRLPGYLYLPSESDCVADTRWVPFYPSFGDAPDPTEAVYPRPTEVGDLLLKDTGIERDFFSLSPSQWTKKLIFYYNILSELDSRDGHNPKIINADDKSVLEEMEWIRHRRVLTVGDSVDRFMVLDFCEEFRGATFFEEGGRQGEQRTTASCHIPFVNLTIMQWHLPSTLTYRPSWWWIPDMPIVAFEQRLEEVYRKTLPRLLGWGGRPDLVLFQTGFWDERAFREAEHAEEEKSLPEAQKTKVWWKSNSQLKWSELRFVAARVKKVIRLLRQELGEDSPLMYRALSTKRDGKEQDLGLISVDRMMRALMAQLDVEVFEWGKIVYGFASEYQDELHIRRGGLSWLWSDMVINYLFRGAGGVEIEGKVKVKPTNDTWFDVAKNWAECHRWLISWEGR